MRRLHVLLLILALVLASCGQSGTQERELRRSAADAFASGQYMEAEKKYEQYLQDWPKGSGREEAWKRLLSICLDITRDHARAANLLEAMVLEFSDKSPREIFPLLVKLADVYGQGLGRWDKSIQTLERCRSITEVEKSQLLDVEQRLAAGYRMQGKFDLALEALDKALTLGGGQEHKGGESMDRILYDKGQVLVYLKKTDKALPLFQSLAQTTNDPELKILSIYAQADVYEQQGKADKALPLLDSIKDVYPNPEAIRVKIQLLRNKGHKS